MSTILMTSLDEIFSFDPCVSGWRDILEGQEKTVSDAVEFPILDCLNSNSCEDVIWLLCCRETERDIVRRFAQLSSNSVKHLPGPQAEIAVRSFNSLEVEKDFEQLLYYAMQINFYTVEAAIEVVRNAVTPHEPWHTETRKNLDQATEEQDAKNKSFLIQAINEYQDTPSLPQ